MALQFEHLAGSTGIGFASTKDVVIDAGTNSGRCIVAIFARPPGAGTTIDSATCNGHAMTSFDGAMWASASGIRYRAFYLVGDSNIATGNNTCTGTYQDANYRPYGIAASFSGCDGTAPGNYVHNSADSTNVTTATITSAVGRTAFALGLLEVGTPPSLTATSPSAIDLQSTFDNASFTAEGMYVEHRAGDTSITIAATWSPHQFFANIGFDLIPASSGATAVTATGPGNGTINVASTFTFGVDQTPITGTLTVTPASDKAGTWQAPGTVSLTTASPSANLNFTPTVSGVHTITTTNDGGLANSTPLSFSVASAYTPYAQTQHLPMPLPLLCQ